MGSPGPRKSGAGWSLRGCGELLSHLTHREVHRGPGRRQTYSRSHRAGTEPEQELQSPAPLAPSLTWTHTASCSPGLGTESPGFLVSRSPFGALGRPPLSPVLALPLLRGDQRLLGRSQLLQWGRSRMRSPGFIRHSRCWAHTFHCCKTELQMAGLACCWLAHQCPPQYPSARHKA